MGGLPQEANVTADAFYTDIDNAEILPSGRSAAAPTPLEPVGNCLRWAYATLVRRVRGSGGFPTGARSNATPDNRTLRLLRAPVSPEDRCLERSFFEDSHSCPSAAILSFGKRPFVNRCLKLGTHAGPAALWPRSVSLEGGSHRP